MRPLKLFRRVDDRPPLKDRLAALKARLGRITRRPGSGTDHHRRVMLAGSLAAAIPLPALAATATGPHPDAELLALGERWKRAGENLAARQAEYEEAYDIVSPVLADRPAELIPLDWEWRATVPPNASFRRHRVNLRWTPARDENEFSCMVWTGEALRRAIQVAVPVLGTGGQTPRHVRRWKSLLPIADRFDAGVEAASLRAGYEQARVAKHEAEAELDATAAAISASVATTPEGLACLTRIVGKYTWKDTGGAWPNLLRSAANVSGVPMADIEHKYASTRRA